MSKEHDEILKFFKKLDKEQQKIVLAFLQGLAEGSGSHEPNRK